MNVRKSCSVTEPGNEASSTPRSVAVLSSEGVCDAADGGGGGNRESGAFDS